MARKPVRTRMPDRPSHARIRLRRTRLLLRPMAWSLLLAVLLVGGIAALYAAQPAGRLRALIEDPSPLSRWAGLTVQEVVVEGRRNTPRDLLHAALRTGWRQQKDQVHAMLAQVGRDTGALFRRIVDDQQPIHAC